MSPFKRKMKLRRLLIDCSSGLTAKEIADKTKTHPKTVSRDLKDLASIGGLRVMKDLGVPELYYYSVDLEVEVNRSAWEGGKSKPVRREIKAPNKRKREIKYKQEELF